MLQESGLRLRLKALAASHMKPMLRAWLILTASLVGLQCFAAESEKAITVFAAASLTNVLQDLGDTFTKDTSIPVRFSFAASSALARQIENGARVDVFFSADLSYPRALAAKGMTVPGSEFLYAIGRIVVWVPNGSAINVEQLEIESLRSPTVRYIAIANPGHAPYGKAAVAAMQSLGVYDAVKGRLAYGENVAQTLQYVQQSSADIGIIALSLALSPTVRATGHYWEIPIEAYPQMEQGGVILKTSKHIEVAQQFRSFILGEQGRTILKSYGFYLP